MVVVNRILGTLRQYTSVHQKNEVPSSSPDVPPPYEKVIAEDLSKINTKQVQQAVALAQVATDMQQHQWMMALELYLVAIEKMITALPLETDANVRKALASKLERCEIIHDNEQAGFIESILVFGAIALKRSPLPDLLACCFAYILASLQAMDKVLRIRQRAWRLTTRGLQKLVEIDQQFRIHQVVLGALYAALLSLYKAGVAYTEA